MPNNFKEKYLSSRNRSSDECVLICTSPYLLVFVDLEPEVEPHLEVRIGKNDNKLGSSFFKTDDFNIIKPFSKPNFEKSYRAALAQIHKADKSSGEYYFIRRRKESPKGLVWFSGNAENKMALQMELYDEQKEFSLVVDLFGSWNNIHHFRKAGNVADPGLFHLFFKGVLQFLHDDKNYLVNYRELTQLFFRIIQGNTSELASDLFVNTDSHFAIEKIRNRIQSIEKRLIEQDSDTIQDRIMLRGELKGTEVCLSGFGSGINAIFSAHPVSNGGPNVT